ncbi:AT-hook motif nuclear-localized protein 1 [Hibiscus syriacus]|uniref:AT-hook motif nuclear-localized protein n=1 Tax=Hibiscus syriacus TaxID=106335 RepID=A0A6A3CER8_HIBSY|nr:AT-hook motif nuclear-localized protein 1-like [Hibiscus syriacus]KAE8727730.1 AT-hook motif nuclear-localized protein 1 [Hibiscus syriacus]
MESREAVNNTSNSAPTTTATTGVTVVGSDAPSNYHIAPRSENSTQNPSTNLGSAPPQIPPQPASQPVLKTVAVAGMPLKKKRGRPRKYGPDGSVTMALSPKPISTAAPPPVIDFSVGKRGKVKTPTSFSKAKFDLENIGEWVACSVGANFTPHIITVNSGEDVTMKIISFSQQGPRAICILSANGVISNVTLRQPDSSGGTLTYEGRFEILSLSGSFMPNDTGATRSRSGGMSVSLASPNGRVVGGGVAGLLVAAGPVQVVVGSFLAGNQHEPKLKKQKHESFSVATPVAAITVSSADPKSITTSFRSDSWPPLPSDTRNNPTDIDVSVPGS